MLKTFDIVIVNWNSGDQLKECVESVKKSSFDNSILNKVVVVDNDSKDDSLELAQRLNYDKLEIIKNSENLGFGKACNLGAKNSQSDFILFLNPDAMVYEDTFHKLFDYIEKNDNSDVVVYGAQLISDDGNIQRTCARFPNLSNFLVKVLGLNKINSNYFKTYHMEEWNHNKTKEINHVIGAFYVIKREIFNSINGFDERYFVYFEDLDLSKRVYDSGYKTIYLSEVQAYHKGGGTSEQVKALRFFYSTRSSLIYSFKHLGIFKSIIFMFFVYFIEPFTRTAFLVLKRSSFSEFLEQYKGFGLLYKDTFNIIKLGLKK